ncbi:MBL fold metallo-hydrolase [bacterium]|nr:MBL fold metallo-hydrolase [bacterium]
MRITSLIENTRLKDRKDLKAEHGLSLHVYRGNQQILFDIGATGAFEDNAVKLGVDIRQVDRVVISHHHFDHGGGLVRFLEVNQRARIYLRRCDQRQYTFRAMGILRKDIGLDRSLFENHADRFDLIDPFTEISPGVFILTQIEKPYPLPKGNRHLFAQKGNIRRLDDFDHELIMVIREEKGLVVFTGCSHSGIRNMIETVVKQFPKVRIKAVFGGFHMIGLPILNTMAGSRKEVEELGKEMLKYPIDKLYTGHCTGMKAYRILKRVMGDQLELFPTGSRIEV